MVAIKNMFMPCYCCQCDFKAATDASVVYCKRTYSELSYEELFNARPNNCPLVEIEVNENGSND